jgi:hypothetical protein
MPKATLIYILFHVPVHLRVQLRIRFHVHFRGFLPEATVRCLRVLAPEINSTERCRRRRHVRHQLRLRRGKETM